MKIRQILESVSAGGMGTGSIATAPAKAGKMIKRQKGNLFAETSMEEDTIRPNLVAALKQHGFKGPFKLGQLPEWKAELSSGYFDDDSYIMIKGNDPKFDEFVAKGGGYGYAHGMEGGYQDGLSAQQVVKAVQSNLAEVGLGDYRKKAAMQKAQAGMGAMFGKDPEQRAKDLATFQKREKGLNRVKARDEKARAADQQKQMADLVARLPELEAEYAAMQKRYKALGGSDWQYADREQNLTPAEREARGMEGPMNNLWRQIQAAKKSQGVSENKKGVRAVKHTTKAKGIEAPKPRNFVAKNAIQGGAGAHKDKKKAAKQGDVKHKAKELTYESQLWSALERKIGK